MTNYNHWFIRARLKTRQLLLLVALAEEGNIHRAAQVLNMTQPAASKLLKDLEDVLEVPLFDRLPRGMRPTWYGETMIRHARVALASLNQAHDELTALKAGRFGQVSVGAITAPGLTLMPPAVAMVKREQPDLRVSLEIETSPVLIERLEQGKLDILVARLFAEHDKSQLRYEALTEEPVCALVRPGHPLLGVSGPHAARRGERRLDRAARGQRAAPPLRADVPGRRARAADQHHRELGPALHHAHAAAERHGGRARNRRGALLRRARHRVAAAAGHALPMDAFGIITRTDRLLSPAAKVMMKALKTASMSVYGRKLEID